MNMLHEKKRLTILGNLEILEKCHMWVETQLNAQPSFQKLNADNSCQKHPKLKYHIFEALSNFIAFIQLVPNVLARTAERAGTTWKEPERAETTQERARTNQNELERDEASKDQHQRELWWLAAVLAVDCAHVLIIIIIITFCLFSVKNMSIQELLHHNIKVNTHTQSNYIIT